VYYWAQLRQPISFKEKTMKTTRTVLILVAFALAACGTRTTPTHTPEATPAAATSTAPAGAPVDSTLPTPQPTAGLPLPADRGELFAASGVCSVCHTRMVDAAGSDVSIDAAWRSTMMANSTRDPYWRATFSSEVLKHPAYQEIIEDKCTTCHAPMAQYTEFANGEMGKAFGNGFFDPAHQLHVLALDGISCTACHQIRETGFG
jgi:hypothetical protein